MSLDKNHTSTMLKFNIDNQFPVSRNITWHFLIYCSSKARILLPLVPM